MLKLAELMQELNPVLVNTSCHFSEAAGLLLRGAVEDWVVFVAE
jgi:hypothetical protein